MENTKKIALVGLYYDNNLGDPLMVECVEYMYKTIAKENGVDLDFTYVDLFGRKSEEEFYYVNKPTILNKSLDFGLRVVGKLTRSIYEPLDSYIQDIRFNKNINSRIRLEQYFKEKLSDADLVVVVGGALVKYRLIRDFHNPMNCLINVCSGLSKNVFFNAIGVENGYDLKYHSCKVVKGYLNNDSVKLISTRDDIETLYKYVEDRSSKTIVKSSDTAIWVDEIFNIEPDYSSNVVGIGVIDPIRFEQYEQKITANEYSKWMEEILLLLDKKGIKWSLFTNGHVNDYEFAQRLLKSSKLNGDIVERPKHYKELVETINSFGVVFASRLHACIIAYGLDKQIIGVDWNDKVLFFGEDIDSSESFFKPHQLTPDQVVNLIDAAFSKKYDQDSRKKYRDSVKNIIKQSLSLIKEDH